jgi:hypothetical protein
LDLASDGFVFQLNLEIDFRLAAAQFGSVFLQNLKPHKLFICLVHNSKPLYLCRYHISFVKFSSVFFVVIGFCVNQVARTMVI